MNERLKQLEARYMALPRRERMLLPGALCFAILLLGHLLLEVSSLGVETGPVEEPDVAPVDELSSYPLLRRLEPHLSANHATPDFEEALEARTGEGSSLLARVSGLSRLWRRSTGVPAPIVVPAS